MLLKSIFTNSTGILTSRILGFIRDLLTASILGANIYSDIFFVAFKLPNLFRRIFAEGAFTQAFIPAYAKSNHKIRFSSVVFLQLFGFLIILSLLVTLFSSLVAKAIAISTALLNLTMILSLLISKDMDKYEITFYLSYGVLAGGLLQILVHLYAIKRLNLCKIFHFKKHKKKEENKFYKNFMSATLGSSTTHLSAFIDTWLASFLMTGSISYLYYGNRVFQLPLALFAIATSVALFPMIARSIKNKDEEKALNLMKKSSLILFGLLAVSTFIGIVFNEFIISLLFERGAFTNTDTSNTALILSMYLIGLIPFGIGKIFSLWLYAKEQQFLAAKISVYSLGWNIVFSLILIQPFGAAGLAFASTLSGFILFFLTIKAFGFKKFKLMFKK